MTSQDQARSIAFDSFETLLDGAQTLQAQALQFGEAWLKSVAQTQKVTQDVTKSLLKHSYEAQVLWQKYASESVKEIPFSLGVAGQPKAAEKASTQSK
jgi:hypothetical protein